MHYIIIDSQANGIQKQKSSASKFYPINILEQIFHNNKEECYVRSCI